MTHGRRADHSTLVVSAWFGWAVAFAFALILSTDIVIREIQRLDADERQCQSNAQKADSNRKPIVNKQNEESAATGDNDSYYKAREYCVSKRSAIATERQADYALWQVVLGVWILFAAIAAALIAWRAFKETRRQADIAHNALIESNRPWLRIINVTASGSLNFNSEITTLPVTIYVKNVGNAPAINIENDVRLAVVKNGRYPIAELTKEPLYTRDQVEGIGLSLFPQQKWPDNGDQTLRYDAAIETSKISRLVPDEGVGPIDLFVVVRCEYTVPADASSRHVTSVIMQVTHASGGPLFYRAGERIVGPHIVLRTVAGIGQHAS